MWSWEEERGVKCEVMRPERGLQLCRVQQITHTSTDTHTQRPASRGDSRMTNDKVTNVSSGSRAAGI